MGVTILALDPGSEKRGFAIVHDDGTHGELGIVYVAELPRTLPRIIAQHQPEAIVVGEGTAAETVDDLVASLQLGLPTHAVDETNSTREARERYWREHPPQGFWRLIPLSLQTPPEPVDAYAAWVIGDRYLRHAARKSAPGVDSVNDGPR